MIKIFRKIRLLVVLGLLVPIAALADAPAWKIIPGESTLTFTATQNDAPVTGTFKTFTGEINFSPDQLSTSHIKITVDVDSIVDPYNQLEETLKTPEWFNIKIFPQAIFKSSDITKTGDKTYAAKGTLTIRDKTLPITVNFTQEEYSSTKAVMKGSATIKRTAFGIGQGEWADTNAVKDDVEVNFTLAANKI